LRPKITNYLNTLGVAEYRAGLYAKAVATLERGLANRTDPSDITDLLFLAMAHWKLGDHSRARTFYDQAIQRFPDDHDQAPDEDLVRYRNEAKAILQDSELPADPFAH
jgi:tetratricopeptide (TPR) repeat protein